MKTIQQVEEDKLEAEALQMISSCISDMSMKYEVMGLKFSKKLDDLETTSQNLNRKFEALQN
jgi:hypothetical protein